MIQMLISAAALVFAALVLFALANAGAELTLFVLAALCFGAAVWVFMVSWMRHFFELDRGIDHGQREET